MTAISKISSDLKIYTLIYLFYFIIVAFTVFEKFRKLSTQTAL